MEKRYSIREAFTQAFTTILAYKKEFFKLLAVELLVSLSSGFVSALQTKSAALVAFSFGMQILGFVFMLASVAMFFQAFKGEKVSFLEALNKVATGKVMGQFMLLCLMYIVVLIIFAFPLAFAISLINAYVAASYVHIVKPIVLVLYLVPGIYSLARYSMFAIPAFVDGHSVLGSLLESYKLVTLKLILTIFGCSVLFGALVGGSFMAITAIFSYFILLRTIVVALFSLLITLCQPLFAGTMSYLYMQLKD